MQAGYLCSVSYVYMYISSRHIYQQSICGWLLYAGGRQITMRVEDAMHSFWGVLEWSANTILFVWMGIVLAIVLPPSHEETAITDQPIHLEARDAAYVVLLYVWLQV